MKKISHIVRTIIFTSIFVFPVISFAQTGVDVSTGIRSFSGLIDVFTNTVIKSLATLFLSLGLLAFFYGIVQYIWGRRQGESNAVKVGNEFMTWGLIALFVMFSVYGIIKLAQGVLFNGKDVTTIDIPNIQFKSGNSSDVQIGSPSSPGSLNGGNQGSGSSGTLNGGTGNNSITPISCDNLNNGATCANSSGVSGVCGDMGNGTRGCVVGGTINTNSSFNKQIGESCARDTECASQKCDFDTQKCI